jgi:hypothetical protein
MHGIKVLMAKNYIDNLSEEIKKGMLEKAEQSIYPSCAPLGYQNVMGPNGKRIIEPHPTQAPIIKQMFEWYATGQCSLAEVTKRATLAGLLSRRTGQVMSRSNVHRLLQSRVYTGDFDWNGRTYRGSHEPLISTGLFERVQEILEGRYSTKEKVTKHEFTFSGLVHCGHCGCALVGEKKKGKYVYYHCTGNKGKCPEPYAREEVLEACFADLLKGLVFDDQVMDWIVDALHQSHADEKKFRRDAIARLQDEQSKIQTRLDKLYDDRLDGFIEPDFFERKAREWRQTQKRLTDQIAEYENAAQDYVQDGVRLLELAKKAYFLFKQQNSSEKRKLLNFVCSNSTWKDKTLTATFRQPFDLLAHVSRYDGEGQEDRVEHDGHGEQRHLQCWIHVVHSVDALRRSENILVIESAGGGHSWKASDQQCGESGGYDSMSERAHVEPPSYRLNELVEQDARSMRP